LNANSDHVYEGSIKILGSKHTKLLYAYNNVERIVREFVTVGFKIRKNSEICKKN